MIDWDRELSMQLDACLPNVIHIMYTFMLPDALIYSVTLIDNNGYTNVSVTMLQLVLWNEAKQMIFNVIKLCNDEFLWVCFTSISKDIVDTILTKHWQCIQISCFNVFHYTILCNDTLRCAVNISVR